MPYGLKRYQQAESLHFITFSYHHRLPFLSDPHSKSVVEHHLERTRSAHQARIYACVLMPNHVPLLRNEPSRPMAANYQNLPTAFTRYSLDTSTTPESALK